MCQAARDRDGKKVKMDRTCQRRRCRAKEREQEGLLVCILRRMVVVFPETRNQGKACTGAGWGGIRCGGTRSVKLPADVPGENIHWVAGR